MATITAGIAVITTITTTTIITTITTKIRAMTLEEWNRKRQLVENERRMIETNQIYRDYAESHDEFVRGTYNANSPQILYCTQECRCGCRTYKAAVRFGWASGGATISGASPKRVLEEDGFVITSEGPDAP